MLSRFWLGVHDVQTTDGLGAKHPKAYTACQQSIPETKAMHEEYWRRNGQDVDQMWTRLEEVGASYEGIPNPCVDIRFRNTYNKAPSIDQGRSNACRPRHSV